MTKQLRHMYEDEKCIAHSRMTATTLLRSWNIGKRLAIQPDIRNDFAQLAKDMYVHEGFRRKQVVRFVKNEMGVLTKMPHGPVLQSKELNPIHGGVVRVYKEFQPSSSSMKVIETFFDFAGVNKNDEVLVQAQRIEAPGLPTVEGWHRDGASLIGIYVVARQNIVGGISEFRAVGKIGPFFSEVIPTGTLVIFDDDKVEHRVTPIACNDENEQGVRDILIMTVPSYRP